MLAIIPYRRTTQDNRSLRYALRSLDVHHNGKISGVVVIGDPEPWLRNCQVIDHPHNGQQDALCNVISKIYYVAKHLLRPTEDFMLTNDDIFLQERLIVVNGTLEKDTPKKGMYQRVFDETLSRLAKSGRPPWEVYDYENHGPMFMHASTVLSVIAKWGIAPYAYRTLIGNWMAPPEFQIEKLSDPKLYAWQDPPVSWPYFSVTNEIAMSADFARYMAAKFPNPCRFEAGGPE